MSLYPKSDSVYFWLVLLTILLSSFDLVCLFFCQCIMHTHAARAAVLGRGRPRGGWTWSHDMKSKWSRGTNSRYLMYSSSSSPFICPVELDQWYHSKELTLIISERPSTRSNPYVPEELWPLENCGGCGRMARNSQKRSQLSTPQ